jgi:septal ring factor EnvC (AmiA/AmiB activator)
MQTMMRSSVFLTLCVTSDAAVLQQSPINRLVGLITELKAKTEADGRKEQQSYDKFACWCENTLARKAAAITDGKDNIEKLQTLIEKLNGELGAHSAEIDQLKKDIADNLEAQKDATELRTKENDEFETTKNDNEQCTGALEAAIKVLSGAGTGKKGFLETMQQAQLMSVVSGVRKTLKKLPETLTDKDVEALKSFLATPEKFAGQSSSLIQGPNSFGDYAPQSGQIQGILKGMYDAFLADLEKNNAEEAEAQKSFEELMATKKQEQETLETTLKKQESDSAHKTKELADSKVSRDDTIAQVDADEKFFEETKQGCKDKAAEWSERSRLRTEELTGITKAIEILTSPEAQATFESSATTFLQTVSKSEAHAKRQLAFTSLRKLATKYHNLNMANLALSVRSGGHFDKIMVMIDDMVATLRKEEAEDIAHRDRCQSAQNKNGNDKADLDSDISKAGDKLTRLGDKEDELKATISSLEDDLAKTKSDMEELLEMRNEEVEAFRKALKDDADAVALMDKAIVAISSYYKKNKIPLEFVQKKEPEYSVDPDKAPETTFSGSGARKSESGGIVAIMEMIKEDTINEMETSKKDDAKAQKNYEKERGALRETYSADEAAKIEAEKELADTEQAIADTEEAKGAAAADLAEEQKLAASIQKDCAWVETHFDSRRDKRKAEIEGLQEAKNFLAGAGIDADDELD